MACMSLAVLGSWVALWAMVGGCCSHKVAQGRGRSCTAVAGGSSHRIQIAEGGLPGAAGAIGAAGVAGLARGAEGGAFRGSLQFSGVEARNILILIMTDLLVVYQIDHDWLSG